MAFTLPSLDQITNQLLSLFKRFPFVVLVSLIGTIVAVWYAGLDYETQNLYPDAVKLIFICILGISFLFALATFLEQVEWSWQGKLAVNISGIILLVVYYYLIGDKWEEGPAEVWYRYALFILSAHLLVAFAPFFSKGKLDSFWEYNKALFLRFLVSVLYSGVLFAGLSIALLSIDNLLGLDVKDERYLQLFFFLGGIFNTWFFLAGISDKDSIASKQIVFPKGLRIFVQFVLIPLVSVYIFILYLYLIKIIVEWQLPNGWVANLVLSFSIAGILSLLLLFPIRENSEHKWIRWYSKGYYLALIPLIGLLMLSIGVRISEYGVTINRYYVATLGVWLTGMVFYFILSKARSIKVIPISLCVITLLTSFGPLGAFAVSERSQTGRFEELLSKNEMIDASGFVIPKSDSSSISFDDRKGLSSILNYLIESHGIEILDGYFNFDLVEELDNDVQDESTYYSAYYYSDQAPRIMSLMGLRYVSEWEDEEDEMGEGISFYYGLENKRVIRISEFDLQLAAVSLSPSSENELIQVEDINWEISYDFDEDIFEIKNEEKGKQISFGILEVAEELNDIYLNSADTYSIPQEKMLLNKENEELKIAIVFTYIGGNHIEEAVLTSLSADIYIKEK